MRIFNGQRKIPRPNGRRRGNPSRPRNDPSYTRNVVSKRHSRNSPTPGHGKSCRKVYSQSCTNHGANTEPTLKTKSMDVGKQAFEKIKKALSSAPVLCINPNLNDIIHEQTRLYSKLNFEFLSGAIFNIQSVVQLKITPWRCNYQYCTLMKIEILHLQGVIFQFLT